MIETKLLKKLLNWAKTSEDDETTELSFNLLDMDEFIPVAFEKNTKIEYSEDTVLIWEITTIKGDASPVLIYLDKLISVQIS